jgi:uncharacterized protein YkwD
MKSCFICILILILISAAVQSAEIPGNNSTIIPSELTRTTDLAIIGSITPHTAEMQSPLSASILLMNNGPAAAKEVQIDYYLARKNATGSTPVWIHQKTAEVIPAFYQDMVSFTVPLPGGIDPGPYSLFSTIRTTTPDRNQTNNEYLSGQPINVKSEFFTPAPGLSDLGVKINSVSPSETGPDYPFTINYTVSNLGNSDAGTFHTGFYLSQDQVIEPSDLKIWDEVYYQAYPGMSEPGSATDIIPSHIPPGDYYLGAIADFTNMVLESDEENNSDLCQTPVRILDLAPPVTEEFLSRVTGYIAVKTNLYRQYRNLPNLSYDPVLGDIAIAHSRDMAERGYFSHVTPEGVDPTGRAEKVKYPTTRRIDDGTTRSGIAENIIKISSGYTIGKKYSGFVDPTDPEEVADVMMIEWISSPQHNKNLVDPSIERIGAGVTYNGEYFYGTQNFF